jgi:hypothetical protein
MKRREKGKKSISSGNAHAMQKNKKKKCEGGGWVKFDIESNAINLGFAIQSTLTRFTLFYVCIYAKSANVSSYPFWLA